MIELAWTLALTIWGIGIVHAYWAVGGVWPAANETALARTVVGARAIKRMPPVSASLAVAVALAVIGSWPLAATGQWQFGLQRSVLMASGVTIAAVFILRGLAAHMPAWQKRTPEMPFAKLDRSIYSPLCFLLGLGFIVILIKGTIR